MCLLKENFLSFFPTLLLLYLQVILNIGITKTGLFPLSIFLEFAYYLLLQLCYLDAMMELAAQTFLETIPNYFRERAFKSRN